MTTEHKAKPLCYDGFCGLGGWTDGFLAQGWRCVGFDNVEQPEYRGEFRLRDVMQIHGSELADADCLVFSPPCTEFSYMAMPWKRGKQIAAALRGQGEFPEGYKGSRTVKELTTLFDACFRIQREAIEAAGHYIPMVVENVRGAKPWVGKARWNFGSFYLWGDVPALMPIPNRALKSPINSCKRLPGSGPAKMEGIKLPGNNSSRRWEDRDVKRLGDVLKGEGFKTSGMNWSDQTKHGQDFTRIAGQQAADGLKNSRNWWSDGAGNLSATTSSKSNARKAASAQIAKIPFALSNWIARTYKPQLA